MQLCRVPQLAAALLLATLVTAPVEAQARPDTLALSCERPPPW